MALFEDKSFRRLQLEAKAANTQEALDLAHVEAQTNLLAVIAQTLRAPVSDINRATDSVQTLTSRLNQIYRELEELDQEEE